MQMRDLFKSLPEANRQRLTDQRRGMWFHNEFLTMLQTFSFIIGLIIFPRDDKNVSIRSSNKAMTSLTHKSKCVESIKFKKTLDKSLIGLLAS